MATLEETSDVNGDSKLNLNFEDLIPDSQDSEQFEASSRRIRSLKRSSPSTTSVSKRFKRGGSVEKSHIDRKSSGELEHVKVENHKADIENKVLDPCLEYSSSAVKSADSPTTVPSTLNGHGTLSSDQTVMKELLVLQKDTQQTEECSRKEIKVSLVNGTLHKNHGTGEMISCDKSNQSNFILTSGSCSSPKQEQPVIKMSKSDTASRNGSSAHCDESEMEVVTNTEECAENDDTQKIDESCCLQEDLIANMSTDANVGSDNDIEIIAELNKAKRAGPTSVPSKVSPGLSRVPTPFQHPQIATLKRETLHSTPRNEDIEPPNGSASSIDPNTSCETPLTRPPSVQISGNFWVNLSYDAVLIPTLGQVVSRSFTKVTHDLENVKTSHIPRISDVSTSTVAAAGSDGSKTSPGSVTSTGPFQLSRHSMASMVSASSSSSGGSSGLLLHHRLSDHKIDGSFPIADDLNNSEKFLQMFYNILDTHAIKKHTKGDTEDKKFPPIMEGDVSLKTESQDESLGKNQKGKRVKKPPRKRPTKMKKSELYDYSDEDEEKVSLKKEVDDDIKKEKEHSKMRVGSAKKKYTPTSKSDTLKRSFNDTPLSDTSQSRKKSSVKKQKLVSSPSVTPVPRTPRIRRERSMEEVSDIFENREKSPIKERSDAKIGVGVIVFAKWKDKKYYSGVVQEKKPEGKWLIGFDDGEKAATPEKDIIIDNWLPKNFEVLVSKDKSSEYFSGTIVDFKLDEEDHEKLLYGVVFDGSKECTFVPRTKIALKEEQVQVLKKSMGTPASSTSPPVYWGDLSLDNLVPGKRHRVPSSKYGSNASASAETAPAPGKIRRVASGELSSDQEQNSPASCVECVIGLDPEYYGAVDLPTPKKLPKGLTEMKSGKSTSKSEHPTVLELLGPVPPEGSTLFMGKSFLLTYSDQIPWKKEIVGSKPISSDGEGTDDYITKDKSVAPFDRERLYRQLRNGGAVVYDKFEEISTENYSTCYLIANKAVCTAAYVQCVAYGIKPVNNAWVINMCKGLEPRIEHHALPAGWSLEKNCFVPYSKKSSRPLRNKELLIVSDVDSFVKFWGSIVVCLGGKVRDSYTPENEEGSWLDGLWAIVADPTCWPDIREDAERRQDPIPILTTAWLLQCLINWKLCPIDGHPSYKHEYYTSE